MEALVGVIGASSVDEESYNVAFKLGKLIVDSGYHLICGGLGGVMEAACRGAQSSNNPERGKIIGIIPGSNKYDANPYVEIVISTGIGYARNMIIACSADVVIAVSGGSGTLSEIAMAWQYGKPIIVMENLPGISAQFAGKTLDNRRDDRIIGAKSPEEAIKNVKSILSNK